MAIGLDLDNTLIDYSEAYPQVSARMGLPPSCTSRSSVRQALRTPADDLRWQEFQSLLYTDGLEYARLAPGARTFLESCLERDLVVFLISHKTSTGPAQFGSRDLRTPASEWLRLHGVVPDLIAAENVSFHSTADEKIQHIATLRLEAFVDDLTSVLNHPNWPLSTRGILYHPPTGENTNGEWSADFPTLAAWLQGGRLL